MFINEDQIVCTFISLLIVGQELLKRSYFGSSSFSLFSISLLSVFSVLTAQCIIFTFCIMILHLLAYLVYDYQLTCLSAFERFISGMSWPLELYLPCFRCTISMW